MENLDLTRDYMGSSEASHVLGVSSERVRQFMKDGRIRSVATPIGKVALREDVERLRDQRAGQTRSGQQPKVA